MTRFSSKVLVIASHVKNSSSSSNCPVDKSDQHFLTSDKYDKILTLLSDRHLVEDVSTNANMTGIVYNNVFSSNSK